MLRYIFEISLKDISKKDISIKDISSIWIADEQKYSLLGKLASPESFLNRFFVVQKTSGSCF